MSVREKYASPYFTKLDISAVCNRSIDALDLCDSSERMLKIKDKFPEGDCIYRGIPFSTGCGKSGGNTFILLKDHEVVLKVPDPIRYKHIVFLHTADFKTVEPGEDGIYRPMRGVPVLGDIVADYTLKYTDGTEYTIPVKRRFNINEPEIKWGENCFEALSHQKPYVFNTVTEDLLNGKMPSVGWGKSQCRVNVGASLSQPILPNLWLYSFENPYIDKELLEITFIPRGGTVLIFGIAICNLKTNPLYWEGRKRAVIKLPQGEEYDLYSNYDRIDIDLGSVISVSPVLEYDNVNWEKSYNNKQPIHVSDSLIIDYTANSDAVLYFGDNGKYKVLLTEIEKHKDYFGSMEVIRESDNTGEYNVYVLPNASRKVRFKVTDKMSGMPVPVKIHIHGEAGEYLPPMNRHRKLNTLWFEDYSADYANGRHFCTYIDGEAEYKLPLGVIYVEVSKGFEILPIRKRFIIDENTETINIQLEHVLRWRNKGWVTADTHVHFISPQTALLEGEAEGVNVVNLLATQVGELFTNIGDYDGKSIIGSKEDAGSGEYLVRVGTENRQMILGHISLIGYEGRMILPLTAGGPNESALGDPVEETLSGWAEQCRRQNGIVVLSHFPEPRAEGAATIILNLADGIEVTSMANLYGGISPYSLSDWYRYLNCGYNIPIVGGTDKMLAETAVGTVRTYARIPDRPFTYENWKDAVKSGYTFVTYGPLVDMSINGMHMGGKLDISSTGGTLDIDWEIATVTVPVTKVELVVNGDTVEVKSLNQEKINYKGIFTLKVNGSGWVALRVRGRYPDKPEMIVAHTSAIMFHVDGKQCFSHGDAVTILEQIEGVTAYLKTIGTKADEKTFKQLLIKLTQAHRLLHNRMHLNGLYHNHTNIDNHHKK